MTTTLRNIIAGLVWAVATLTATAQTDTIATRLHEVAVVGVKQSAATDLSAVSTITAAEAERLNIVSMKGASQLVPNFYLPDYGSRMTSSIYVRGLGARIDQPVVGLSVDNVPYLNKDAYDFDLFDIDRIEVLRGAQSILNGRNTMAGQVNITTLSPWKYQGVRVMAEYGRANTYRVGMGVYARPKDNLAWAMTGYTTGTDGFFRNERNNGRLDRERQTTIRAKVAWHPSERLSVSNVISGQVSRQGGYPYMSLESGRIAYDDTCYYRRNSITDGLTIGWTGKRVIVTSVTSYQYIDDNMTLDQDFLPLPYFTLTQKRKEHALTEDLYAKGTRGQVSWLGGVFAFYKHTDMDAPVTFKDTGIAELIEKHRNEINPVYPIRWDERRFVLGSDFIMPTRGIACYGQTTWRHGRLTAQLGLRLDVENATLDYYSHCNTAYTTYHILDDGSEEVYRHTPLEINNKGHLHKTFVELLPKIAIGYDLTPEVNIYANVAKGYKAGGYNSQMFSDVLQQELMERLGLTKKYDAEDIVSYKPEKSWNIEAGIKSRWWDGRGTLNATLYYIACVDQQLTAFPDGLTTGRIMTNAGRTRSYGAELSVSLQPCASLELTGTYGYTNARFVRYDNGKEDLKGKRLPYAPQNTAYIGADWQTPFAPGGVKTSVCLSARGVGDIYWDDANRVCQPYYVTCGASVNLAYRQLTLTLWGENITGTRYNTFYFLSMGNAFVQRAKPMTWGATLRYCL